MAISRAAIVLFGKAFPRDFTHCALRVARVDATGFRFGRELHGPAFALLAEAERFARQHAFPMLDALREIIVNALVHRDYSVADVGVSVTVFEDRVEIRSPGGFTNGITPASIFRAHPSVSRNPLIADVFYRAGLMSKWGRGIDGVTEMCARAGSAAPSWNEADGVVIVDLPVPVGRGSVGRQTSGISGAFGIDSKATVRRKRPVIPPQGEGFA